MKLHEPDRRRPCFVCAAPLLCGFEAGPGQVVKFEPRERTDGQAAADKMRRGLAGARDVTAKAAGAEGKNKD